MTHFRARPADWVPQEPAVTATNEAGDRLGFLLPLTAEGELDKEQAYRLWQRLRFSLWTALEERRLAANGDARAADYVKTHLEPRRDARE